MKRGRSNLTAVCVLLAACSPPPASDAQPTPIDAADTARLLDTPGDDGFGADGGGRRDGLPLDGPKDHADTAEVQDQGGAVYCQQRPDRKEYPECDDGIECTLDWCNVDSCVNTPIDGECPGSTVCLNWSCDPLQGCVTEVHHGLKCPAVGNKCSFSARCNDDGECVVAEAKSCPAGPCKENGECDPATGKCLFDFVDGTCDDDNPCTVEDQCIEGECVGAFATDACPCGTDAACTQFEDGDLCNGHFSCVDGHCYLSPESVVNCPSPPPGACFATACIPETGECPEDPFPAGQPCDDDNPCTNADACDGEGTCVAAPSADGSPCDLDADLCTLDKCQNGLCVAGSSSVCAPPELPCFAVECVAATGKCTSSMLPDGTPCSSQPDCDCDGSGGCLAYQTCLSGLCLGGTEVCADCQLEYSSGHPCDDDLPDTVGDFCFEQQCVGVSTHLWKPTAVTQSGFADVTWFDGKFIALAGTFADIGNGGGPGFVEFSASNGTFKTTPYSSLYVEDLHAIDGKVAVGKPDRIFYRGLTWTKNNKLKQAVVTACPALGQKYVPQSVVHRHWGAAVDQNGEGLLEFVVIGMRSISSVQMSNQCLMALCGRSGDAWTCGKISVGEVFPETPPMDSQPGVTALWAPLSGLECTEPAVSCLSPDQPLIFAYEFTGPDERWVRLVAGHGNDESQGSWETILDAPYATSGMLPDTVRDVRVDTAGNVLAAGADHFLFARPAGETGHLVQPFTSLGTATAHYSGLFRSAQTTVLAVTLVEPTEQGNAGMLWVGLLAGSPALLLDTDAAEQPQFNQFCAFQAPGGFVVAPWGIWGIAGLALPEDHLSPGVPLPPGGLPTLVIGGTLVEGEYEKSTAALGILTLQ